MIIEGYKLTTQVFGWSGIQVVVRKKRTGFLSNIFKWKIVYESDPSKKTSLHVKYMTKQQYIDFLTGGLQEYKEHNKSWGIKE